MKNGRPSTGRTNWDQLRSLSDEQIEANALADLEATPPSEQLWDQAFLQLPSGKAKQQITLRLDPEVTEYFRQTGKGYQSRMNAVLRHYVETQKRQRPV